MKQPIRLIGKYSLIVLLFSYGLFYISYKYGQPSLANRDFFRYEKMVDTPLNLSITKAPFVLRQLPTTIAFLIKKAGIFYPNTIAYREFNEEVTLNSQVNLFSLILSNYLSFVLSIALILYHVLSKSNPDDENIVFAILAYFLGYFMTTTNIIAPLTQGWGWLACCIITIGLANRHYFTTLIGILIALFSRETLFIFFMVFTIISWLLNTEGRKDLFLPKIALLILLSVIVHFILRVLFTHGNENQLSPIYLLKQTFLSINPGDYLFQTFLCQGVLIYALVKLSKKSKEIMLPYLVSIIAILIISGSGAGRIIGESFPFVIIMLFTPNTKPGTKSPLVA